MRLTADHPVRRVTKRTRYLTHSDWCPAGALQPGDQIVLNDHRAIVGWDGEGAHAEGYLIGLLIGDGQIKADKALLSVWASEFRVVGSDVDARPPSVAGIMQAADEALATLTHRADFRGWQRPIAASGERRLASGPLRKLALALGASPGHKTITPAMEARSSDFCRGLLRGLFDADGSVQGTQAKGVSVRLSQSDMAALQAAQRMLLRLGIASTIYRERRAAGVVPDARWPRRPARIPTAASHELVISGDNLARFAELVGFADTDKAERLDALLGSYKRALNRERFTATVESVEPDGIEPVYDVTVADVHAFDANGLLVHNCGEQPLPSYGCCCLGSIDLTRFVQRPFEADASFDEAAFTALVRTAVRMLDNVLDVSLWPLPQQQRRSDEQTPHRSGLHRPRRCAGDARPALRHRGRAREGGADRAVDARPAYDASVDLAAERGAFPLFNANLYLSGGRFASRLPAALKERIRAHGMRNSHLLSIAPTGTISLAFADNASNGIEPAFSWTYTRKKRDPDGRLVEHAVEDHAWRLYRHLKGNDAPLTDAFVTALEMSAAGARADGGRGRAVHRHGDQQDGQRAGRLSVCRFRAALPAGVEFGLKGLATYRPNTVLGSVLSTQPAPLTVEGDANRRLALAAPRTPVLASLRWPGRPELPSGNAAWTFMIEHPFGGFALFVGEWPRGENGPRLHRSKSGSTAPSSRAASARSPRRCRWTCAPTIRRGCN